jgi:hypothetical protein
MGTEELICFHSILLRCTHRDDPSHHQPASWIEVSELVDVVF